MKTKNGYILTFSDKMQFCAVSCFATCDWFCPMTSHIRLEPKKFMENFFNRWCHSKEVGQQMVLLEEFKVKVRPDLI